MKKTIVPAIIAKSAEEMKASIERVQPYLSLFQLDVMDGQFVPNHSLDFPFDLPQNNQYEAHLMVGNPEEWIDKNWKKVHTILAHIESCKEPRAIIEFLKGKRKIGFVLNPETSLRSIEEYLDQIDQVLIMTVHPGAYGSKFLPEALDKVRELRDRKSDLDIEVDGGINRDTINEAAEAGANLFVSGSYIMKADNVQEAVTRLENILRGEDGNDQ